MQEENKHDCMIEISEEPGLCKVWSQTFLKDLKKGDKTVRPRAWERTSKAETTAAAKTTRWGRGQAALIPDRK